MSENEVSTEDQTKELLIRRIELLERQLLRAKTCEGCTWKEIRRFSMCENCRRNAKTPDNYY